MSDKAPPQRGAAHRILELEDQVKGLMETVTLLHQMYHLDALNIPKPDQYVKQGGYTMPELQQRFANPPVQAGQSTTTTAPTTAPAANTEPQEVNQSTTSTALTLADVQNLPQYTYSPLDEASSEIRLLALDTTGSGDDIISCRLITASLDDAPEYHGAGKFNKSPIECFTPLSYCWGSASFTEHIIVDGHSFLVTPSLHTALRHFRNAIEPPEDPFNKRDRKNETYWWIDAICVNQKDVAERNSQVGLMTRLYRAARMVHVWLGEERDNSSQAMNLIKDLAYLPSDPDDMESWNYIPKKAGQTHRPDGPGRRMKKLPAHDTTVLSDEEKLENYTALVSFYQRPWFSRIWIRQEIALPEDVTFHCGVETCNWKDLMRTADILTYLADEYHLPTLQIDGLRDQDSYGSCFQKALGLYELREEMGRWGGQTYGELNSLALKWRDCQATDPRDKVFAMLPLINPDETDIQADYHKDKLKVYKETTLSLLRSKTDFLSGCQNPSRSNGLPSWVPDLEVASRPLLTETDFGYNKSPDQWGDEPDDVANFVYISDQERLDIEGVIFDEVQDISKDDYISPESSNEDIRTISEQWREFYETRRDALFESWEAQGNWDGRDECISMFDIPFNESNWQWQVLRNTDVDRYRLGGDRDGVRFKRWDDDTIDHDPVLKKVKRLLPSDDSPFSSILGQEDEYFAYFRPLAIGRRMFFSSRGAIGLLPAEARVGDAICFFDGCGCPFVIRKAENDTWVIVGQACK